MNSADTLLENAFNDVSGLTILAIKHGKNLHKTFAWKTTVTVRRHSSGPARRSEEAKIYGLWIWWNQGRFAAERPGVCWRWRMGMSGHSDGCPLIRRPCDLRRNRTGNINHGLNLCVTPIHFGQNGCRCNYGPVLPVLLGPLFQC